MTDNNETMNRFRVHIIFENGVHTRDGMEFETMQEAQYFCENNIKYKEETVFQIWKLGEDASADRLDCIGKLCFDWQYQ